MPKDSKSSQYESKQLAQLASLMNQAFASLEGGKYPAFVVGIEKIYEMMATIHGGLLSAESSYAILQAVPPKLLAVTQETIQQADSFYFYLSKQADCGFLQAKMARIIGGVRIKLDYNEEVEIPEFQAQSPELPALIALCTIDDLLHPRNIGNVAIKLARALDNFNIYLDYARTKVPTRIHHTLFDNDVAEITRIRRLLHAQTTTHEIANLLTTQLENSSRFMQAFIQFCFVQCCCFQSDTPLATQKSTGAEHTDIKPPAADLTMSIIKSMKCLLLEKPEQAKIGFYNPSPAASEMSTIFAIRESLQGATTSDVLARIKLALGLQLREIAARLTQVSPLRNYALKYSRSALATLIDALEHCTTEEEISIHLKLAYQNCGQDTKPLLEECFAVCKHIRVNYFDLLQTNYTIYQQAVKNALFAINSINISAKPDPTSEQAKAITEKMRTLVTLQGLLAEKLDQVRERLTYLHDAAIFDDFHILHKQEQLALTRIKASVIKVLSPTHHEIVTWIPEAASWFSHTPNPFQKSLEMIKQHCYEPDHLAQLLLSPTPSTITLLGKQKPEQKLRIPILMPS